MLARTSAVLVLTVAIEGCIFGPSSSRQSSGTVHAGGQVFQGTTAGTGFHRTNGLELWISSCSNWGLNVNVPGNPGLGTYDIVADGVVAGWTDPTGQRWRSFIGPFDLASGTITLTSVAPTRVAGSFSFTLGYAVSGTGGVGQPPTVNWTLVEGSFDLEVHEGVICP